MREYAKIKKEREVEQLKKEALKIEELKQRQLEEIATANPLMSSEFDSYSLKKRWHEETVFKNQAKNVPKAQKRFINDTVRSDFHRKFMSKYIQ